MFIPEAEFSNTSVYTFFLFAVVLYFAIRIIRLSFSLIVNIGKKESILRFFPIFEMSVWLLFFTWAIPFLYIHNYFYAIIIFFITLILILMVAWYGIKDFIAGVIFRTSSKINKNEFITILNYSGKILNYTNRTIEIETDTGKKIIIPYSKILPNIIEKSHSEESLKNYTFRLNVEKQSSMLDLKNKLYFSIVNLPWSSLKKEPKIKIIDDVNSSYLTEITIYALDSKYFDKIEDYIRSKFETV